MLKAKVTVNIEAERTLKAFEKIALQAVDGAAITMQSEAKQNLMRNKTNFDGNLSKSIAILRKPSQLKARVFTNAGYGKYIEFGRAAGGWPNLGALREWVRRKLRVNAKEVDGVTYLVGRKIAEQGSKPQPYFTPAFEIARRQLKQEMKMLIQRYAG